MPEVINLQRKVAIKVSQFTPFAEVLFKKVSEASGRDFTVAFVADDRMQQLNSLFRGKDSTTDVLSFPNEPDEISDDTDNLGDIVISAQQAERQAAENDMTVDAEIKQLMLHGLLHLCGYDHETDNGEMDRRELALRRELDI